MNKKSIGQFVKFALVGVMNTLVDFLVFQALNLMFGWTYLAQVMGYCAGVANSYLWNSRWTFREEHRRSLREAVLFLAVNLASLGVSLGVMWLCMNPLGITDSWAAEALPGWLSRFVTGGTVAKLIATPCAIVVNFIGNKLFVFRGGSGAGQEDKQG